jgi:hypothetical protein
MWVGPGNYASVINLNTIANKTFTMPWGSAATLNYFKFGSFNNTYSDVCFYQDLQAPNEPITAIV